MTEFQEFIDSYRRTWEAPIATNDASSVTRFFNIPYLAVSADGSVSLFTNEVDVRRFNESRLAAFRKGQITRWLFRGCDVLSLGSQSAFLIVNWDGQRADGMTALAWRHYYNLARTSGGFKILVSTF